MSNYVFVSEGIVVENKPQFVDVILVAPITLLSDMNTGLIKEQGENFVGSKKGLGSGGFESQNKSNSYIRATWKKNDGGNRASAPDVYQGEKVNLYKYEGTQEYFWEATGREPGVRGREDVINVFSNMLGGGQDSEADMSNSYFTRFNTKDGFIELGTSTANGEPCTFNLKIDTKGGAWHMIDGNGNSVKMDAVNGVLDVKTTLSINFETQSFNIKANEINFEADTFTNNISGLTTFETPMVEMSDNLTVGGNLELGGSLTGGTGGSGSATFNGPMEINGDSTVNGNSIVDGDLTVTGSANGSFPGPKTE